MSNDKKTLADVKPGGMVRLGDQAELDRHEFQAWTRELLPCPFCGNVAEFVPYKDNGLTLKCKSMGCIQRNQRTLRYGIDWLRTSMAEHWNTRALSAQPFPGGQGGAQTIEKLRAMMDHSFGGPGFVVYGTAQSVAEVERRLAPDLAARQPVGQIVGYMDPNADFMLARPGDCVLMGNIVLWREPGSKYTKPLYDAPPAQAVDLGQFRDLAQRWADKADLAPSPMTARSCSQQLLALIDSKAVGK